MGFIGQIRDYAASVKTADPVQYKAVIHQFSKAERKYFIKAIQATPKEYSTFDKTMGERIVKILEGKLSPSKSNSLKSRISRKIQNVLGFRKSKKDLMQAMQKQAPIIDIEDDLKALQRYDLKILLNITDEIKNQRPTDYENPDFFPNQYLNFGLKEGAGREKIEKAYLKKRAHLQQNPMKLLELDRDFKRLLCLNEVEHFFFSNADDPKTLHTAETHLSKLPRDKKKAGYEAYAKLLIAYDAQALAGLHGRRRFKLESGEV